VSLLYQQDRPEGGGGKWGNLPQALVTQELPTDHIFYSFTGAYSPGRTFGLLFSGFLDHTHTDTR
jgi:hypothetical protein